MATLAIKGLTALALSGVTIIGGYEIHKYVKNLNAISVKEHLLKEGRAEFLNTKEFKEEDKETQDYKDWQEKIKDSKVLEKLKSFIFEDLEEDEMIKINKLTSKCKDALEVKSNNGGFENALEDVKLFCIKTSA